MSKLNINLDTFWAILGTLTWTDKMKENNAIGKGRCLRKLKPLALIFVTHLWYCDVIFYPEDIFAFDVGVGCNNMKTDILCRGTW